MGLYKELAYQIEGLKKQQTQIYPDACDYGIVTELHDETWSKVQNILSEARESFKVKITKHKMLVGVHQEATFVIPWEKDQGYFSGTKYTITYIHCSGKRFFSIDSERVLQKESPFC
jgi:hypothetical protein